MVAQYRAYSNQQRITQGNNLTKSVVTTELTKFLRRRSICRGFTNSTRLAATAQAYRISRWG